MITIPELTGNVSDLNKKKVNVDIDGKAVSITILSMASIEFKKGVPSYTARIRYALDNKIERHKEEEVDHGMGIVDKVKVPTEWEINNTAILMATCLQGLPEGMDPVKELIDNPDFALYVESTAAQMQVEFIAKKNT